MALWTRKRRRRRTVIYSIYPPEVVLQATEAEERHYFTVEMEGRAFVLEMANGQARIVRLISPNPRDYLDPNWQPGTAFAFGSPSQTSYSPARNRVT